MIHQKKSLFQFAWFFIFAFGVPDCGLVKTPAKPESVASFVTKPESNSKQESDDTELERLLTKIDEASLPSGYKPSKHQAYVDARMSVIKPEQRARVGKLWKEKRRIQPEMQNAGASFVRILEYVAGGEKLSNKPLANPGADSSKPSTAALPSSKNRPVVSEIDPKGVHWHQWRGPNANGTSSTANPPLQWSEEKNVRWKVAIEGQGNASPIVWGDKVFLLSAINTGRVDPNAAKPEDQPKRVFGIKHPNTFYKFEVLCLDKNTGKELWRQTAIEKVPHEGTHHDADFASASPMTDGERLYCWFGSAGMYCYDLDGKKLWERDLGKAYIGASLGEGCSPVVYRDKLVIVRDQARQSSIEVLDSRSGKTFQSKVDLATEKDLPSSKF
ncbi:MAG: PQQ-binding-like beta-propeller repeat protein [Mariniblastus sp.]